MRAFAILTAAVFVAIGVGVALVSGLPNQLPVLRTYGSAPLRFEAAFPASVGQPKVRVPDDGFLFAVACSEGGLVNVSAVDFAAISSNGGSIFSYTSSCPLPRLEVTPFPSGVRRTSVGAYFVDRTVVGCRSFEVGIGRRRAFCHGGETLSSHGVNWGVSWTVEVYAPTRQVVEQFLQSFKPLPLS